MKKPLKKRYIHLSFIALLLLAGIMGWVNVFSAVNLIYALYLAMNIVRMGLRGVEGRCRRIIHAVIMSIAVAFLVPFMLIPAWIFGVTYLFRNPEIIENIPEYKFRNVVLKNASKFYNYNITAYEGILSEEELHKLAQSENWQLQEIKKPQQVRYTASALIKEHRLKEYTPEPVTVTNGYSYSTYNNTDSGIMFTWCRDSGKFYFFASSR